MPAEPVTVYGDAARLQQVVANLLHNASKYTPARGRISVSVHQRDHEAVVQVRDTGIGIPPDKLASVFDLFVQLDPSLERSQGGLGIGLTLVKRIVELHGGTVYARSEGPGRGAEFTVRLPLAAPMALEATAPPAPPVQTTARRVLVIEDHPDGREALACTLERYGHEVLSAATGQEGIDTALSARPDIALVDIGLPDVDGYEVARRLRERLAHGIRLVALTGYGQPQDRARARAAGFDAHLVKPIEPDQLAQTLETLSSPSGD
jgi:CheY-like chemotaxis protein/anti-sigma regulatory factor (Ser/Thr protein kinase)